MNEEEKKADKLVNSLKEWGKIHLIVKDRCHAKLTYNEVYLLLALIEKLQKENKELKNQEATQRKINELLVQRYSNSISLQKIKDNLIKYQEEYELLLEHQNGKESNRTKYLRGRIRMCQELLESEEKE